MRLPQMVKALPSYVVNNLTLLMWPSQLCGAQLCSQILGRKPANRTPHKFKTQTRLGTTPARRKCVAVMTIVFDQFVGGRLRHSHDSGVTGTQDVKTTKTYTPLYSTTWMWCGKPR